MSIYFKLSSYTHLVLHSITCCFVLCCSIIANADDPLSIIDENFYKNNIAELNELTLTDGHGQNDNTVIIRLMVLHNENSTLITLKAKNNELQNRLIVKTRRKTKEAFVLDEFEINLEKHHVDSLSHVLRSSEYGDLKSKVIDMGIEAAPSLWVYEFIDKSGSFILTRQAPFFYSIQSALYGKNIDTIQKFSILDTFGVMLWLLSMKESLPVDR